jgi:hypothetical protein
MCASCFIFWLVTLFFFFEQPKHTDKSKDQNQRIIVLRKKKQSKLKKNIANLLNKESLRLP